MSSRVWCDDPCSSSSVQKRLLYFSLHNNRKLLFPKLQEQVSRGVETLPRTACYLMSGSLFSLRVVLNAESGALRSQNTPGGYGSLAFSEEAR